MEHWAWTTTTTTFWVRRGILWLLLGFWKLRAWFLKLELPGFPKPNKVPHKGPQWIPCLTEFLFVEERLRILPRVVPSWMMIRMHPRFRNQEPNWYYWCWRCCRRQIFSEDGTRESSSRCILFGIVLIVVGRKVPRRTLAEKNVSLYCIPDRQDAWWKWKEKSPLRVGFKFKLQCLVLVASFQCHNIIVHRWCLSYFDLILQFPEPQLSSTTVWWTDEYWYDSFIVIL